jgi:hypothetical protein
VLHAQGCTLELGWTMRDCWSLLVMSAPASPNHRGLAADAKPSFLDLRPSLHAAPSQHAGLLLVRVRSSRRHFSSTSRAAGNLMIVPLDTHFSAPPHHMARAKLEELGTFHHTPEARPWPGFRPHQGPNINRLAAAMPRLSS